MVVLSTNTLKLCHSHFLIYRLAKTEKIYWNGHKRHFYFKSAFCFIQGDLKQWTPFSRARVAKLHNSKWCHTRVSLLNTRTFNGIQSVRKALCFTSKRNRNQKRKEAFLVSHYHSRLPVTLVSSRYQILNLLCLIWCQHSIIFSYNRPVTHPSFTGEEPH